MVQTAINSAPSRSRCRQILIEATGTATGGNKRADSLNAEPRRQSSTGGNDAWCPEPKNAPSSITQHAPMKQIRKEVRPRPLPAGLAQRHPASTPTERERSCTTRRRVLPGPKSNPPLNQRDMRHSRLQQLPLVAAIFGLASASVAFAQPEQRGVVRCSTTQDCDVGGVYLPPNSVPFCSPRRICTFGEFASFVVHRRKTAPESRTLHVQLAMLASSRSTECANRRVRRTQTVPSARLPGTRTCLAFLDRADGVSLLGPFPPSGASERD